MTESEYLYFFKNYSVEVTSLNTFDIHTYIYAVGNEDAELIENYRLKYGVFEEEYITEWLAVLIPYFKRKESDENNTFKLSTQNEIYLEQRNDVNNLNYLEESEDNWTGEPRALKAFLAYFQRINNFSCIEDHLNKIFPMICQVIDDYRAEFKIQGLELVQEFMRIVPANVFTKFNLHLVLYESFKVNVTFESDDLVEKSIETWINLIKLVENFPYKEFLKRADELLLLLCRDVGITSKLDRKVILLKGIGKLVELMQYTAIRYMRKVIIIVCEVVKENFTNDEVLEAGQDAIVIVLKNCWIRMNSEELQTIIKGTFGGCSKIEKLLEKINEQTKLN